MGYKITNIKKIPIKGAVAEVAGTLDEKEIKFDIELCNDKQLCIFCHNPHAVLELFTETKESQLKLFVCLNCINKIKFFKDEIYSVLTQMSKKDNYIDNIIEQIFDDQAFK